VARLRHGLAPLVLLVLAASAAPARADWLVMPFAGSAFGGETTSFLNLDNPESRSTAARTVVGVAAAWTTNQVVGIEGEFLYGPRFFTGDLGLAVGGSRISTVSGGLIVTLPLSVTRESLRPYATGGLGAMQATVDYSLDFLDQNQRFATLHVGGGAIGFISPDVGVRFDVRHVNSLNRVQDDLSNTVRSRLRFWRLTVGVVIRVG
jgi:hypothetical protein